jgi:hypothetical protein
MENTDFVPISSENSVKPIIFASVKAFKSVWIKNNSLKQCQEFLK